MRSHEGGTETVWETMYIIDEQYDITMMSSLYTNMYVCIYKGQFEACGLNFMVECITY